MPVFFASSHIRSGAAQPRGAIPDDSNLSRFSDRPHSCRYLSVILWTFSILTPHLTQCSAVAVPTSTSIDIAPANNNSQSVPSACARETWVKRHKAE